MARRTTAAVFQAPSYYTWTRRRSRPQAKALRDREGFVDFIVTKSCRGDGNIVECTRVVSAYNPRRDNGSGLGATAGRPPTRGVAVWGDD